jgi:Peptidase family M48
LRFASWVADHERAYSQEPEAFRRSTVLIALLAYAGIGGALLLSVTTLVRTLTRGLGGHSVGSALMALGALWLLVAVLRTVLTTLPAPVGRRVQRDQAPALFNLLDKIQERTGGPRFDSVLIDGQLHARVVQRPRFGLLGGYRNTLVLGLPLLFLLSARQLAAVLTHECWHLGSNGGALHAWVYRLWRGWSGLAARQEGAQSRSWVTRAVLIFFFTQFFPRFNARAMVLSRQQALEADAAAHEASGAQASGQALVALHVARRYLDEIFWPEVFGRARQGGDLRQHPYRELRSRMALSLTHPQAKAWLSQACKKIPSSTDSLPSLHQRLEFAQCEPKLPDPVSDKAAATLLGKTMEVVLAALDSQWQIEHAPAWAQAVRSVATRAARLNALNEKREKDPLSASELAERAQCIELTAGAAEALPAWQQAQWEFPAHPDIALGLVRLIDNEPDEALQAQALTLWSVVADSDSAHAVLAMEQCIARLERQGLTAEAQTWRTRLKERQEREEEALQERLDFSNPPTFVPTDFTRAQIQDCLDVLIRERTVGAAYLVRKQAHSYPQRPFYVLLIERSRVSKQPPSSEYAHTLRRKLNLPGEFMVIDSAQPHWKRGDGKSVLRQIKRTADARIYAGSALGGR